MPSRTKAFVFLALVTVGWGMSFSLIKALNLTVGASFALSADVLGLRFLLAAVLFTAWLIVRRSRWPVWSEYRQGALIGLTCAGGALLQAHGLNFALASTVAFLTQATAVLIPLWIAIRHRHLPSPAVLGALILVLCGVGILSGFSFHTFRLGRGEFETLLSCFFLAAMVFVIESPRDAANDKTLVAAVFFFVTGVLGLLTSLGHPEALRAAWQSIAHPQTFAVLGLLSLVSTVFAFLWMIRWQPAVTATEAGIIYCLEPVWAALLALFVPALLSRQLGISYPNEVITPSLLIGAGCVLSGSVLIAVLSGPEVLSES